MKKVDYVRFSKVISHALRHEPAKYNLVLEKGGWVNITDLIESLKKIDPDWISITALDLERMINSSEKKRHEISGEWIRANYGHSISTKIEYSEFAPPKVLYHGTSMRSWNKITQTGLKPMKRQYVDLSRHIATALVVGKRKSNNPIVLKIDALDAHHAGVIFFEGGEDVVLSTEVPIIYVQMLQYDN